MKNSRQAIGILAIMLFGGAILAASAQTAKPTKPPTSVEAYCIGTGGEVETRYPVYGTNGSSSTWLQLAGLQEFCQYTQASDGSRIHVSLKTLTTTLPTLAALAYYSETPWNGSGEGNPASLYCTQLGGSDLFGGATAAGGGWVEQNTTDVVLEACIFPDNSTIDSWGLFYHSDAIIRGIDLSTVLGYKDPYAKAKKRK
jgi:putative hemolysin